MNKKYTFKELIERQQDKKLWAEATKGSDAYCGISHGDGKLLLMVTMWHTRPFSHFIRVDSRFDDDDIEEMLALLEEYFGEYVSMIDDEETEYDYYDNCPPFPIVCYDSGDIVKWNKMYSEYAEWKKVIAKDMQD